MTAVFLLLVLAGAGFAADDTDGAALANPAANEAEYRRLSQEIQRLAERQHWEGVEHKYIAARETGVDLSFADHLSGAQAAMALGHVRDARHRYEAARDLDVDRGVIEALWNIDTLYGEVALRADPGEALSVAVVPFDPQQAAAIAYANERLGETGVFTGYLPQGDYTLGNAAFTVRVVEVGAEPVRIDVRSEKTRRKQR